MTKARDIASAIPAPSTVSSAELGYLDGVTSAIQTQVDAKTAKSTLTTTGDIYYASGASTPARLGIGSSAQVLTVASGIPSWATASSGGMTLLSTTTLSGATTTLSSIPQTYNSLVVIIYGMTGNTADETFFIDPNGATQNTVSYMTVGTNGTLSGGAIPLSGTQTVDITNSPTNNSWSLRIDNYASTVGKKPFIYSGQFLRTGGAQTSILGGGGYRENTAITSLVLSRTTNTFSGGTVLLYGVK